MKNRMKNKLNSVLKAFTVFAAAITLATAVSCKSNLEDTQTGAEQGNPVFTFSLAPKTSAARTILPEDVETSDLKNFSLTYKLSNAEDWVEVVNNATYSTLSAAKIELTTDDIKKEITFTLTAKKDSITYKTSRTVMVNGGQNEVELTLKRYDLGSGTDAEGDLLVNIDLKGIKNVETVTKVALQILDTSHNPIEGFSEYVKDITNRENPGFQYQKNWIPVGSYMLSLTFYAGDVPVLKMNPIIQIADGLTTEVLRFGNYLTEELKNIAFNDLYTLSFDLNAGSDTVTYPASTKISRFVKDLADINVASPERTGYLFTGWFMDSECTQPLKLPVYEDTKVYASWQSLSSDIDGTYFVTMETLADFVKDFAVTDDGYGTQAKPATLKFFGAVTDSDIYTIETTLNTNTNAYFALDFTEVIGLTSYCAGMDGVENLVSIIMPESITRINADWMIEYPNLKEITVSEENEYYKTLGGVLYSKDGRSLEFYPPKREGASYTIPEGVERIKGYSFHGGNLQTLTLPASLSYIYNCAFVHTSGLLDINVAAENENYKSIDGVVYSTDGTRLFAFPSGRTSFEIPAEVKTIQYYSLHFDTQKLTQISLEASDRLVYYSASYYGESTGRLMTDGVRIDTDKILQYTNEFIYIVDITKLKDVQVYDTETFDVSDSSFTIVDTRIEEENYTLYRVPTVPGTKYRIYWVDSSASDYTNPPENIKDSFLYCFDSNFTSLGYTDDSSTYEFIANGKYAYICGVRYEDREPGVCAFRVRKLEFMGVIEPVVKVSVKKIDDPADKFNITYTEVSETEWRFKAGDNNGDYYYWYVDGEFMGANYGEFHFYPTEYEEGLHTITVELSYGTASASIQVEIK